MQATEVNNQDKYKSYIQRRRVGFDSANDNLPAEKKSERSPISDIEDLSSLREDKTYEGFFSYSRGAGEENKDTSYNDLTRYRNQRFRTGPESLKPPYSHQSNYTDRMDTSMYQKKRPVSYKASNRTAIEENKTTLLAIRIIKQALACFAILGLIVFLQQRTDTAGALLFIKSQVVDNHTEVSSLISGVENIITECSRIFGGSP